MRLRHEILGLGLINPGQTHLQGDRNAETFAVIARADTNRC